MKKQPIECLNVDGASFFQEDGDVVMRLFTPMRQYDVFMLPRHAEMLGETLSQWGKMK